MIDPKRLFQISASYAVGNTDVSASYAIGRDCEVGTFVFYGDAGDFARELLWACSDLPLEQREWQDICFVDDNLEGARERLQRYQLSFPVIATTCEFSPSEDDVLICAIGDPRSKLNACERLQARGGSFTNVIHPSVAVGPGAMLGNGVIVTRFSGVRVDVHIGNFVTINSYSGCGHDAVLEDGCTVSAHCEIGRASCR